MSQVRTQYDAYPYPPAIRWMRRGGSKPGRPRIHWRSIISFSAGGATGRGRCGCRSPATVRATAYPVGAEGGTDGKPAEIIHVAYAVPKGAARGLADGQSRALVSHLKNVEAAPLAQAVAKGQRPRLSCAGVDAVLDLPEEAAPFISAIDGRRSLGEIAGAARMTSIRMGTLWPKVRREPGGWGLRLYSGALV